MISLKFAKGLTVLRALLLGVMYSESGLTITELARTVAGGKAKVCHFVLSTKAVASVVLSVVRATGGITTRPCLLARARVLSIL